MNKIRFKSQKNELDLPELNEVTLKYRLDLLKINSSSRNNQERVEGYTINKKNLFERLNCCKGLNYDSDILRARKKELKQDMKTLMHKVNQTLNEVEKNVNKYNEKKEELLKKKCSEKKIFDETKDIRSSSKTQIMIEPVNQLDRLRILLSKEKLSPTKTNSKVKNIEKLLSEKKHDNNSSNKNNYNHSVKKKNKKVIIEINTKKVAEVKLPMINHRILKSNTPQKDSNNSIYNFDNSSFSSQEENDIDEYLINNNKLLVKKFVLPKSVDESLQKSFSKSRVKLDKNRKILLGDLINEGEIIKLQDSIVKKQKSQEYIPTQHTENTEYERTPNQTKKVIKKCSNNIINMKKLSLIRKDEPKKVKKSYKFPSSNIEERQKLKQILNNDFMKLEEISFKINTTLDSALELLYNNAIALEN